MKNYKLSPGNVPRQFNFHRIFTSNHRQTEKLQKTTRTELDRRALKSIQQPKEIANQKPCLAQSSRKEHIIKTDAS